MSGSGSTTWTTPEERSSVSKDPKEKKCKVLKCRCYIDHEKKEDKNYSYIYCECLETSDSSGHSCLGEKCEKCNFIK